MKYDFNQPIDRTLDHCAKYDEAAKKFGRSDVIPMWIADMDLRTAQPIMDAIAQRNELGTFGYTSRPAWYYEAVCSWQKEHNHYE